MVTGAVQYGHIAGFEIDLVEGLLLVCEIDAKLGLHPDEQIVYIIGVGAPVKLCAGPDFDQDDGRAGWFFLLGPAQRLDGQG